MPGADLLRLLSAANEMRTTEGDISDTAWFSFWVETTYRP
jgi:hypothetical protein